MRQHTIDTLLKAWHQSKSPHTIAAYSCDLEEFAVFVSRALAISPPLKVPDALAQLFKQGTASGLRHSAITVAIEQGQKAGVGLDQIRHFSRHKQVATMMLYRDERDQAETQAQLARIVAGSIRQ